MTFIQKSIQDENNLEIYLLVISISLTKRYLNIDCIQFKLQFNACFRSKVYLEMNINQVDVQAYIYKLIKSI